MGPFEEEEEEEEEGTGITSNVVNVKGERMRIPPQQIKKYIISIDHKFNQLVCHAPSEQARPFSKEQLKLSHSLAAILTLSYLYQLQSRAIPLVTIRLAWKDPD